ncbi:alpha-1A adrenergic receptor [Amia ocellicauda]|uniref:alpha-1A adrenergic receptor n=1 Tax=Amia ocellicauda TaxID=2972642 RepID=UPI00346387F5
MVPLGENMTPESLPQNCSNCTQAPGGSPSLDLTKAVALGLVLGLLILFGILGNILVILSVACHRNLQTVTHYFIVNLAVADLLLTSTVLPFSAIFEILGHWVFGRVFCNIWAAVDVLCCTASIMSLCVISVDRYVGVSYPLRYPALMTEKRAVLALLGLWALSITISIGPLFGWKEPAPEDETVCKITEEPGYAIFSAVGSFYLPLAVILAMYCRVYVVARRETKSLREGMKTDKSDAEGVTLRMHRGNCPSHATPPTTNSGHTNAAGSEEEALHGRLHFSMRLLKFSHEKKAAKTLGIVVGCFVLCWLPFFLVMPIGSIFPAYRPSDTVFKITFWLGYFNSCMNPIIYPCSSQEFKKAFQNVLRVQCLKRKAGQTCKSHSLTPGHRQHPGGLELGGRGDLGRSPSATPVLTRGGGGGGGERGLYAGASTLLPPPTLHSCRAEAARVCSKSLLRACCCVANGEPTQFPVPPLPSPSAPVFKVHKLSLCHNGEAV